MVDNEFREKRQRFDSSSSMDRGKGSVVDDVEEIKDDIDRRMLSTSWRRI